MRLFSVLLLLLLFFSCFFVSACSTKVSNPPAPASHRDAVTSFKVDNGLGRVHIYLGYVELYKKLHPFNEAAEIFISGQRIGVIGNSSEYIAIDLYPGEYIFSWELFDKSNFYRQVPQKITVADQDLIFLETLSTHEPPSGLLGGGLLSAFDIKFFTSFNNKYKAGKQEILNKTLVRYDMTSKDIFATVKAENK